MKISYERLNQIIEEEVTRFKKLNEISANVDPSTVDGAKSIIQSALNPATPFKSTTELKTAISAALGQIK